MIYTLGAFVNVDPISLLIVLCILIAIGFFIGRAVLSKKLSQQKKYVINIYSGIFGLIFTIGVILAVLFLLR
jgi:hypothetical protein